MSHDAPVEAPSSAPGKIRYCAHCAAGMVTREYSGKPRRVCPECGYIHFVEPKVGVGVMVVRGREILLVRRRMNPEKGRWSIPAGFLDHGDDPVETAVREAREETGLEVAVTGLVDVFRNPLQAGGATIFVLYRAAVTGGTLEAGDDADDAGFFGPDALPDIAFPSTEAAVRLAFGEP